MNKRKVYINGKIIDAEQANVSILDRGFLYGDGVFETLRTYNKRPFLLDQHIKRLLRSLKLIKIKAPLSAAQLKLAVLKTIGANNYTESYIKIIATRGQAKEHGLDPKKTSGKPTLIILVEEQKPFPPTLFTKGLKAIVSSVVRPEIPTSRVKSLCYLNNILAKLEAKRAGADEAFLLDERGNLAEGTVSNIFLVRFGTIYTPSEDAPILPGLTRNLVIKLAKQAAFHVVVKMITPKELYTTEECFITHSGAGIVPITRIWQKKIGTGKCGPITENLMRFYDAETKKL